MATWIAHLRVAEKILEKKPQVNYECFTVGNIGPDSGVPNEDYSSFDPPRDITHWMEDGENTNAEGFYIKYLKDHKKNNLNNRFSFYLGYYVHLLTDVCWKRMYDDKKKTKLYKEGLEKDKNFIWVIKKDWYGLDYLFLDKNPNSLFFTIFKNVTDFEDYLEYFPKGAFTKKVNYIKEFYLGENDATKENFIYLTENEMNDFIIECSEYVANNLRDKGFYLENQ